MIRSFRALAGEPCTVFDELALAVAREFQPADAELALSQLDGLAAELAERACGQPEHDALACRDLLDGAAGFRACSRIAPEYLMLDAVLERGTGHPLMLAVVYAEVARRAGVSLRPVGTSTGWLVAHTDDERPVMLDPHRRGRTVRTSELPSRLRWLCAHEVGFAILGELVDAYALAGDLERARYAAELRLSLPLSGDVRTRVHREIRGLDARLN